MKLDELEIWRDFMADYLSEYYVYILIKRVMTYAYIPERLLKKMSF